jgi:hypothetical protein
LDTLVLELDKLDEIKGGNEELQKKVEGCRRGLNTKSAK